MSGQWIRIAEIGKSGLPADQKITLMAMALEECAAAQALVMIHGQAHGAGVYALHGGHVRFDGDGEPVIWSE